MENNIDYFIICHNQEIIIDQLSKNIAQKLPNCKFLLVGDGATDQIKQYDSQVIICRDLSDNLEEHPYLCSFTAWYAVVKNGLYQNNNICLLEYDIELDGKFHQTNTSLINKYNNNNYIIAYNKTLIDHYVFYKSTPWLDISLKKIHNINLKTFVSNTKKQYRFWPTSTNITLSTHVLKSFIDWFNPMTKLFCQDPLGSYVQERAFFIYCVLHNIDIFYSNNVLTHHQVCSHKSQDIYGTFLGQREKTILEEKDKEEYHILYDNEMFRCLNSASDI
jgi:hypothetical protein